MFELIFHTPWWLPTSIVLIGVVLFVTGNNRREFRIRLIGLILVCLAVVLVGVSCFVDTPPEKAEKGTHALVQACVKRDWTTMKNLMDPSASVSVVNAGAVAANREQIVAVAQHGAETFGLKTARVLSTDSTRQQDVITVTIDVLTEQESFAYPLRSTWEIEWQQTPGGVRIFRIRNLKIGNESGEQAKSKFPKP